MKKLLCAFLSLILSLAICSACADGFQTDYDGIERAAESVLLLEVYDEDGKNISQGSGFIAFDRHTIVTNYHVIDEAYTLKAVTDRGETFRITQLYAADEKHDLALLVFEEGTLPVLEVRENTGMLHRAEPVLVIGSPEGEQNSVSLGNIAAFRENEGFREIQFTAPISSGSSGGALFDNDGKIIGVTYASIDEGQNLNYAIDIDYARKLYDGINGSPMTIASYLKQVNEEKREIAAQRADTLSEMLAGVLSSSADTQPAATEATQSEPRTADDLAALFAEVLGASDESKKDETQIQGQEEQRANDLSALFAEILGNTNAAGESTESIFQKILSE